MKARSGPIKIVREARKRVSRGRRSPRRLAVSLSRASGLVFPDALRLRALHLAPRSLPLPYIHPVVPVDCPTTARRRYSPDMSTFTPDTVTKPKRRSVKKLEKQQGFAFPNGLSSLNIEIRQRAGPIGDLYESLKSLNKMEVLNASELEQEARDLFHELGPRLWPRDSTQAWWLFQQNNDEYPRNLHYDDEEDRTMYVSRRILSSLPPLTMRADCGVTGLIWSRRSASTMKTT